MRTTLAILTLALCGCSQPPSQPVQQASPQPNAQSQSSSEWHYKPAERIEYKP